MLAAMLLAVGLYSCTEDPLFEERARVAEGLPARVMLDFRSEKSCVETRAAQDATNENRVNNLYVFIFNPAGEVHYRNFFTDDISYNGDYSKGSVMIETTSLNKVQIVCIANLSTESVSSGYDVKKSDMESITSRSDLEAFVMKMDEHTVERSTQFMMTGYAYDDKKFHEQPCQHSRYGKRSRLAGVYAVARADGREGGVRGENRETLR